MKRYRLTEKGAQFFDEQNSERLQRKFAFTPPSFVDLGLSSPKVQAICEPLRPFTTAFFNLRRMVGADPSEQTLIEVRTFLQDTTANIEALVQRIPNHEET